MSNIVIGGRARIPRWLDDIASFREWIQSEQVPDHGQYSHLKGELWVDISMERIWHNQIKNAIAFVLTGLALSGRLGRYFPDGMFLTNTAASLSTEPDGMFASRQTLESGLIKVLSGEDSLEVIGTPDMTLEVVSPSTVQKDTEVLRDLYWQAGIGEYWLVQKQGDDFILDILRRGDSGYVSTRKNHGWVKSKVFGKSFRLAQEEGDEAGPNFLLEMR